MNFCNCKIDLVVDEVNTNRQLRMPDVWMAHKQPHFHSLPHWESEREREITLCEIGNENQINRTSAHKEKVTNIIGLVERYMFSVETADIGNMNPRKLLLPNNKIKRNKKRHTNVSLFGYVGVTHNAHSWTSMCHDQKFWPNVKKNRLLRFTAASAIQT